MVNNYIKLKVRELGEGEYARVFCELSGNSLNPNLHHDKWFKVSKLESSLDVMFSEYSDSKFLFSRSSGLSTFTSDLVESYVWEHNDKLVS